MKSFISFVLYLLSVTVRSVVVLGGFLVFGSYILDVPWRPLPPPETLFRALGTFAVSMVFLDGVTNLLWKPFWRITRPAFIEGMRQGFADADVDESDRPRRI